MYIGNLTKLSSNATSTKRRQRANAKEFQAKCENKREQLSKKGNKRHLMHKGRETPL